MGALNVTPLKTGGPPRSGFFNLGLGKIEEKPFDGISSFLNSIDLSRGEKWFVAVANLLRLDLQRNRRP